MGKRVKKSYPNDFKTTFGVATVGMMSVAAGSFMSSNFTMYLTDYSGIANAVLLSSILLVIGRFVDAIDDPIQGWIMDSSKPNKHGKYRRFCLWGAMISAFAMILLYNIPNTLAKSPLIAGLWIGIFYLLYDFGASFYAGPPLIQTLSDDEVTRSKHFMWNRIFGIFVAIPLSAVTAVAVGFSKSGKSMHDSFGLATILFMVPILIITVIGTLSIKEGKHYVEPGDENSNKVSIKDIGKMLTHNKAMLIHFLSSLMSGFMWTLIFATEVYYLKWGYCSIIQGTDVVANNDQYSKYIIIVGLLQMLPMLIAAMFAPGLTKKLGSSIKTMKFSLWVSIVPGLIMFLLQFTGLLQHSIVLYIALLATQLFGVGLGFVPGSAIWTECMDYNAYKTGKEMSGLVNSLKNFLEKGQGALAGLIVSAVLIAIGYNIGDGTTWAGAASSLPTMLNWFIVVSGLIPSILAIASILVYKFYPITPEVREEMKATIAARKAESDK